jgi:hypothetical protein
MFARLLENTAELPIAAPNGNTAPHLNIHIEYEQKTKDASKTHQSSLKPAVHQQTKNAGI